MKPILQRNYCLVLFVLIILVYSHSAKAQEVKELEKKASELAGSNNKSELAATYNKLGNSYWQEGELAKASDNFHKSLELNTELGNNNAVRVISGYLGLIYLEAEEYENSVQYSLKSLELNKKQGKTNEMVSDYFNLATAYQLMPNYTESNRYADLALQKALELNNLNMVKSCNLILAENNEKLGDNKKSAMHLANYSAVTKLVQQAEMSKLQTEKKQIESEITTKSKQLKSALDTLDEVMARNYEMQLKQSLHEMELKEQESRVLALESREKLRKTQLYYLSLVLILIVVVLFLFLIQSRHRKLVNKKLREQNTEIEQQKVEIENQRDISAKQHENLTASIQYARRIQSAVIPRQSEIYEYFRDSFILYKPRDIVSGDFYWFAQKDNLFIIAVADCTGHGVPGAFMSMLGVAFLNEIINKIAINIHITALNADEILNQLREKVISSLHQSELKDEPKDGLDIALCIIDTEKKMLQFAGANNPILIIRKGEMIHLKGDKMPVSYHQRKDIPFSSQKIDLVDGDCLYLFSDGFVDQFGGSDGRKYMLSRFSEYLLGIHNLNMNEQKLMLESELNKWKGEQQQIDDILVVGFRFGRPSDSGISNWQDKTILIAEDTDINYYLLAEVLKKTKASLIRVMDGAEAVEIVKSNKIDLVLMDINMPNMDGFKATRLIKEYDKSIPIIIQTAVFHNEVERSKESGADDFIAKPIDLKTFMNKIARFL